MRQPPSIVPLLLLVALWLALVCAGCSHPPASRGVARNTQGRIVLLLAAFLFAAPLLWMLSTAFKAPEDIINGLGTAQWWPHPATLANFRNVLGKTEEFPIWRWTGNSLLISPAVTLLVLVVDSLAAYSYARLRWPGRDRVFGVLVATMLVPGQVLLIPMYLLIRGLGWFDTYWALIVPAGASAFGVFLLQHGVRPDDGRRRPGRHPGDNRLPAAAKADHQRHFADGLGWAVARSRAGLPDLP